MNTFLKSLGQIINAGGAIVPFLGPLIAVLAPKTIPTIQNLNDELPKIAAAIVQVEALGQAMQLPGPKKLELAAPLVAQIVLSSSFMLGKRIKDQTRFAQGIMGMSAGMADILNSLDAATLEIDKPAA